MQPSAELAERLQQLREHLRRENRTLLEVVDQYGELDELAWRMGLLGRGQSFATQIPWWPLIACLGTFSAGKSTFINDYLGLAVQATGNQAVDDRFTVICYGPEEEPRLLPGRALDADPRFPFYRISRDIEEVARGEGARVDSYLQLKSVRNDRLKGRILIDSPGFDADAQRSATLRITDRIIDRADLVLVFFDARHPEPGAMQETLKHLVADTIQRHDSSKFLFILNQIDATAHEDNLEDVMGSWQRAVAAHGLTSGQFFLIYSVAAAGAFENPEQAARYRRKRDEDAGAVYRRIEEVGVERTYRVVGGLERIAGRIEQEWAPALDTALRRWRRWVRRADATVYGILVALAAGAAAYGYVAGHETMARVIDGLAARPVAVIVFAGAVLLAVIWIHVGVKRWGAWRLVRTLPEADTVDLRAAFRRNTDHWWLPLWRRRPLAWNRRARGRLERVRRAARRLTQRLNDVYARPSGDEEEAAGAKGEGPAEGFSAPPVLAQRRENE